MADMKNYFDIFSDVYFNGVLTVYCRLGKYPWSMDRSFVGYSNILRGTSRDARYERDDTLAYIMFANDEDQNYKFVKTRLDGKNTTCIGKLRRTH